MLKHLGEIEKANLLENALAHVVREGKVVTYDLGGSAGTFEMGTAVVRQIEKAR